MKPSPGESVGVLGGTFDPVHRGHLSIARSFLDSGHIDRLWVMLTPDPPHKRGEALSPYGIRLKMLKKAFSDFERVEVSDLERRLETPSYTWRTLSRLGEKYPEKEFLLCIGEDSFAGFTSWKKWRRIVDRHLLLVARRPGAAPRDEDEIPEPVRERTRFVTHRPVEISSTSIRRTLREGGDASRWLPPGVMAIIRSERLYREGDKQP